MPINETKAQREDQKAKDFAQQSAELDPKIKDALSLMMKNEMAYRRASIALTACSKKLKEEKEKSGEVDLVLLEQLKEEESKLRGDMTIAADAFEKSREAYDPLLMEKFMLNQKAGQCLYWKAFYLVPDEVWETPAEDEKKDDQKPTEPAAQ